MSGPHFVCPTINGPKPEWVVFARKVIEAKGRVALTPEQAYSLARETVRFTHAIQGLNHFVEQLSAFGRDLGARESGPDTSDH